VDILPSYSPICPGEERRSGIANSALDEWIMVKQAGSPMQEAASLQKLLFKTSDLAVED